MPGVLMMLGSESLMVSVMSSDVRGRRGRCDHRERADVHLEDGDGRRRAQSQPSVQSHR